MKYEYKRLFKNPRLSILILTTLDIIYSLPCCVVGAGVGHGMLQDSGQLSFIHV